MVLSLVSLGAIFLLCSCATAETITYKVPHAVCEATLHMVKETRTNPNVNYEAATLECSRLGGDLAPAWLAPNRMINFTCGDDRGGDDAGEAFVKDNSEGCLEPHLDQSWAGTAEDPVYDSMTCSGYCKGCARSSEKKAYVCCVGAGCSMPFAGTCLNTSSTSCPTTTAAITEASTAVMLRSGMMGLLCLCLIFLWT